MGRFIEGCDRRQRLLLPDCVDDYIAEDSPVRVVDMFVLPWPRGIPTTCINNVAVRPSPEFASSAAIVPRFRSVTTSS